MLGHHSLSAYKMKPKVRTKILPKSNRLLNYTEFKTDRRPSQLSYRGVLKAPQTSR